LESVDTKLPSRPYPPLLLSLYELGDVLRQGSGEERVSLMLHNQIILLFDYAYDETPLADQWPSAAAWSGDARHHEFAPAAIIGWDGMYGCNCMEKRGLMVGYGRIA
jgi:hypothetical protein